MPQCSVVIPVRGQAMLTLGCLDGIVTYDGRVETIVVDDGSRDATNEILDAYSERIAAITHPSSLGFAAACNAGAARATTDRLLFLNNDTVGIGDWLGPMLEYAEAHPEAGVIGAKLLFPNNTIQHAGVAFGDQSMPFHIYAGFPADHPAVSRSRPFAAVTGACMLVSRELFESVGGFDEGFLNCYEDIDLCLRLGERNAGVHLCVEAQLYHFESLTRDTNASLDGAMELWNSRWGGRIGRDDMTHYLADGLLSLDYAQPNSVQVRVSPELGRAVTGTENGDIERVLTRRVQEIANLRSEQTALRKQLLTSNRRRVDWKSDGGRGLALDDAPPRTGESEQLLALLAAKTRPLRLSPVTARPGTINILQSILARKHYFGGFAATVGLATRLIERGARVRIVLLDEAPDPTEALPCVPVFDATDRAIPLPVGNADTFIATSVWSAHVAHAAAAELGHARFAFLVQEDETQFYPSGSFAALARQAYGLPHVAVFSTELLRTWFEHERRGVFAGGDGREHALVFRNAIVDPGTPTEAALRSRFPRRLLLYARPGATEARNLFELAVLGLGTAISEGVLDASWQFTGIGADADGSLALPGGCTLRLLARQEVPEYRAILRAHDLGLSLMDSPHPSLVPLEMAAAAMPTVTSVFGTKDAASLQAISSNLIPCEPSVAGVVDALREAVARVEDTRGRLVGAGIDWPRNEREAFPDALLDRLLAQLGSVGGT